MDSHTSGRFGRYEILGELGRGAMGIVYKARDPKINRVVALKTISLAGQSAEEEQDFRRRFFREAEAAGRVSHPGIVTIFDVGEDSETHTPFIVMEYVGGQALDHLLSRNDQKLDLESALQVTLELADALDCAHAQGVVHRDLKPSNILLTEDGHAKIADFGVAKLNLANQTLAGRALGTPAYMSPEQLNGEEVDGRSDLFSLGVILYTMVTGHRPFQGNSAITVSFKVVNRDFIPATILNAELPDGLDIIVTRAMAKDPADRYQRGSEMQLAIRELQEARARLSKASPPPSLMRRPEDSPAKEESRASVFAQVSVPNPPVAKPRPLVPHDPLTENLLKNIRNKSYIGVSVLAGLFILGLWVISFGPREVRLRAAESRHTLSVAQDQTPANLSQSAAHDTPAVDTESTTSMADAKNKASVTRSPKPKVGAATKRAVVTTVQSASPKALPKPIPAGQIYPMLANVVHATSGSNAPVNSSVSTPATATLAIEVDHPFTQAHLSIWVDDRLTYTHLLEGTEKKRLIVFHHVQGHELHTMQVSMGKHLLRVQVTSDTPITAPAKGDEAFTAPSTYDQSATIAGDFSSARDSVLHISFKKRGEISLSLR